MKYATLIDDATKAFPELEVKAKEELDYLPEEEGPWVYIFFGSVFVPELIDELVLTKNEARLKRMFEFVEKMASSDDEMVQTVAGVEVVEVLVSTKSFFEKAQPLMGKNTLKMSIETAKWFNPE